MNQTRQHPHPEQLAAFMEGKLDEQERELIEVHVAQCAQCCDLLRGLPHETLVAQLRKSVSSQECEETHFTAPCSGTEAQTVATQIPAELNDHARYRIVQPLGIGGMGVVYQAEHRLMARTVALKVLRPDLVTSEKAAERFRLEVQAAATLSHRNIVAAYDAEQAGDLHFLVMEFIEGVNLSELVRKRGPLSVLHACNYTMQVAQGLQHAFEQGMVHRDMKPHNLMRTSKGIVKILDFGLAKFARQEGMATDESGLTELGATLGTPDYIAPEQARDARLADIRADIYGLGCTLYFLLTGKPPFPDGTAIEKIVAHCEREPAPIDATRDDVPEEVIGIVQRMMAKDPADRWQTPRDVVQALKPFAKPAQPAKAGQPGSSASSVAVKSTADVEPEMLVALPPLEVLEAVQEPGLLQTTAAGQDSLRRSGVQRPPFDGLAFLSRHRVGIAAVSLTFAVIAGLCLGIVVWPRHHQQIATGEWVDLLAATRPSQDAVGGSWQRQGAALVVQAEGAKPQNARIAFRYTPPREYDFEVTFTRQSGNNSIALHFVCGTGQASFDIDAWDQHLVGIQNIHGATLQQDPAQEKRQRLVNGRTYTVRLQVRREGVAAFLDDAQVSR